LKLSWVQPSDFGLFELLDEHTKLSADSKVTNWLTPFMSSVDLKEALRKHLQPRILPQRLITAIQDNKFPLFDIELDVSYDIATNITNILKFSALVTNVGGAPAFNFKIYWEHKPEGTQEKAIIPPGSSIHMVLLYGVGSPHLGTEAFLIAEYESPIGVSVTDKFRIHGNVQLVTKMILSGARLISRRFKRGTGINLDIDDLIDGATR
jgi:hypothetical protein